MRTEGHQGSDTLRWRISCADAGPGESLFNETAGMAGSFAIQGAFTVPASCPVQRFEIFATTGYSPGDVTLAIASPNLRRNEARP